MGVKTLSAESLILLQTCARNEQGRLTNLHWSVCPFLPPSYYKKGENATETLRNIAIYQSKIDKALTELGHAFEEQFTPEEHARANSIFKPNENTVGNSSSVRKTR